MTHPDHMDVNRHVLQRHNEVHNELLYQIRKAAEELHVLGWNRLHDSVPFKSSNGYLFYATWCWLDEARTRLGWLLDRLVEAPDPFYCSVEFGRDHESIVEAARAAWESLLGAPVDATRMPGMGDRVYLVPRRPGETP